MGMWFHNGEETKFFIEGQEPPRDLIQGWGQTTDDAIADFWNAVEAEARVARERDADPDMPLTTRHRLALWWLGIDPTDHVGRTPEHPR